LRGRGCLELGDAIHWRLLKKVQILGARYSEE
jgi:hypothetical protein